MIFDLVVHAQYVDRHAKSKQNDQSGQVEFSTVTTESNAYEIRF